MNYEKVYKNILNNWYGPYSKFQKYVCKADKTYPKLNIKFKQEERKELEKYFLSDGELNIDALNTPFEKLIYCLLWKKNDLTKPGHIFKGIGSNKFEDIGLESLVLRQFGRSIVNEDDPIVDQHTIRAYATMKKITPELYKNGQIKMTEEGRNQVHSYIKWIKRKNLNKSELFMVDRIMFAIGKHIKSTKRKP